MRVETSSPPGKGVVTPRPTSRLWPLLRCSALGGALGVILTAIINPALGLRLFWDMFVPLLPLVFLIAPGLWRNVCPMAALNQLPRTLHFTRAMRVPARMQRYAPYISAALFVTIVPLRKVFLDQDGASLAGFLVIVLLLAFVGGIAIKGKSGWCSTICPMLQLERLYGQSPLIGVRHGHCRPCVGCVRNCYDLKPETAHLSDLHDPAPEVSRGRRWIAGAMPWFMAAFFTQPYLRHTTMVSIAALYGRTAAFMMAGIGIFFLLELLARDHTYQILLTHTLAAFNLFYVFVIPLALQQVGLHTLLANYALQAGIGIVSAVWLWRAIPRERAFLRARQQGKRRYNSSADIAAAAR